MDAWRVNNAVLGVELFQRLLRVAQGLETPREGVAGVNQPTFMG